MHERHQDYNIRHNNLKNPARRYTSPLHRSGQNSTSISVPEKIVDHIISGRMPFSETKILLHMLKIHGASEHTKIDVNQVIKDPIINNLLVKTGNTSLECLQKSLRYSLKNKIIALKDLGANQAQLVFFQTLDQQESSVSFKSSNETLFEFFEKNISQLTPTLVDNIHRSLAVHNEKNVKLAIMIAAESNVRNWNYISAILDRWEKEGGIKNIGNGTLGQNTFADRSDKFLEKYRRYHN